MSFFHHLGHDLGHIGGKIVHGAERAGKDAGHAAKTAADKTADGLKKGADGAGHIASAAAGDAAHVAVASVGAVTSGVQTATDQLEKGADDAFRDAVNASKEAYEKVKTDIENALHEAELKILEAIAKAAIGRMEHDIKALLSKFRSLEHDLKDELDAIRKSAEARVVTQGAKAALVKITAAMASEIAPFEGHGMYAFGIDFGASADLVAEADVSLGILEGIPDFHDVRGYGSVGVSVGAGEGLQADASLVFSAHSPQDSGGPAVRIILSADFEAGGTVIVSFDLPKLSVSSISIGLAAGEEFDVSAGAGFTYVF